LTSDHLPSCQLYPRVRLRLHSENKFICESERPKELPVCTRGQKQGQLFLAEAQTRRYSQTSGVLVRKERAGRTDLSGLVCSIRLSRRSRFLLQMNYAERTNPPLSRGCSAQAWDVNSSESCTWKLCFISSNDLTESGPEKLKSQAHSSQPHPAKVCPSTHTSLRDTLLPLWGIQPSQADTRIVLFSGMVKLS
jgi:hypothetical protein